MIGSKGASNFSTPSLMVLKKTSGTSLATRVLPAKNSLRMRSPTCLAVPIKQVGSLESRPILSSMNLVSSSWNSQSQRIWARPDALQTTLRRFRNLFKLIESSGSFDNEVAKRIELEPSLLRTLSPSCQTPVKHLVIENSTPLINTDGLRPMWKRPSPLVAVNVNPAIVEVFCKISYDCVGALKYIQYFIELRRSVWLEFPKASARGLSLYVPRHFHNSCNFLKIKKFQKKFSKKFQKIKKFFLEFSK